MRKIFNEAFIEVWGYTPMTSEEMDLSASRILAIANPKLMKLVLKGDEVIGFVLSYPDISEAIQKTRGRMWPLGWIRLLREFKRTEWLNLNGVGLLPDHQGVGANVVMYTELYRSITAFQFTHADFVQVAETNIKNLGDATALGVEWYKRHRSYRRAV